MSGVQAATLQAAVEWGGADRLPTSLAVILPLLLGVLVVVFVAKKILHLAFLAAVVFLVVLGYHLGYLPPRGA